MEEALKSVRDAHKQELDNERYYQHQNYLAMQEQIKSLEEKNKQLSREKVSISDELQRKLNVTQRSLNQMTLAAKYGHDRILECQRQSIESNNRLRKSQEQIKSLEEKNKKLSKDWATEHFKEHMNRKFRFGTLQYVLCSVVLLRQ